MNTLTKPQNITSKLAGNPKPYSSAQTNIRHHESSDPEESSAQPFKKSSPVALTLYGGHGKVRSEKPSARGKHIDITV